MRNLSLALNALLAVAVAVLYYLHFSARPAAAAGTAPAAGQKAVVYVNADSLVNNYEFFKDARKAFEQKRSQLDVELNGRGTAIQREIQVFQNRAGGMLAAEAQAKQLELQKKAANFDAYRQKAAADLAQEEATQTEKLYDNIYEYIKKYNRENGYQYVLGYQKGGNILYATPDLDVTQKLIDGLNKEYRDTQKEAAKPAENK